MNILSSKITRSSSLRALPRERLFSLVDTKWGKPLLWVSSPAGSGKTTLISSYLDSRKIRCLWYQCDEGDSDLATFFYYMGLAAKKAFPLCEETLPVLTLEYRANIPAFTRRYFELLYGRLATRGETAGYLPGSGCPAGTDKQEFALVLDNYQDVPFDSPFHRMIAAGFDALPECIHALVISRDGPPPAFARLQANDRLDMLLYGDIRFTFEESWELARERIPDLDEARARIVHEKTAGWAAGMILMLEKGILEGTVAEPAATIPDDSVFDYFAGEIFNKTEEKVRDFLVKTAFLPVLTAPLVAKMTGAAFAKSMLSALNRHNYFTERLSGEGQGYQYHPLFRAFLVNRAKKLFPRPQLTIVQRRAALLLEQSGQIEDAARLYSDAADQRGLTRMIVRHARAFLMQGRNETVAGWIAAIPREAAENNPWLLYWRGMCAFPLHMPVARMDFEKALEAFKSGGNIMGVYLSWAGIVDTYAFELDEWKRLDDCIDAFGVLKEAYPSFPSREVELIASSRMLVALTLRKTDQPQRVQEWLDRVSTLLQENPSLDIQMDTVFCMSVYYLWKGEYRKNSVLLERAEAEIDHCRPSPFTVIRFKLMKGIHCWITAQYDIALQTLSEGLDIAGKSSIHVFDSLLWGFKTAAETAPGKMESARGSLRNQLASLLGVDRTLDTFFYHVNSAWHAILAGNPFLAAEHMETIAARVEKMGNPYYGALWHIGMAQAKFQIGQAAEARDHINSSLRIGLSTKSYAMEWYSLLTDSYFLLKEDREQEGLQTLRRGMSLGGRYGFVHLEFYQPSVMQFLCEKALKEGIERDYVKGLIRKLGLVPSLPPPDLPLYLEHWPYPILVYTLGGFALFRGDEPLAFSRKIQKKPLEMLKAVIAFGGRNVPIESVMDALWPDANGDLALKSFEMTLSRLRRLLGDEGLIKYSAGQLNLDTLCCWVDSIELDCVFEKLRKAGPDDALKLSEKALSLFKGPFLPADVNLPWTASKREAVRNNLLRAILTLGYHHEAAGQWGKAVEYYRQGVDADDLAEEFYQRLMVCFQQLGLRAEAVRTYNRCRKLLKEQLGVEPSSATAALYSSL